MDSFPGRLSPLQRELLEGFFAGEEHSFSLTGGAALAGFYLGHRETQDLDFFAPPPADLDHAQRILEAACQGCGATLTRQSAFPDFRRFLVSRGGETILVDLVIDRAPRVDPDKHRIGALRLDSLREIAANKVCTLLSRCEIRDLIDLRAILDAGIDLEAALADAETKDGGVNPATLAWLLDELTIDEDAVLPGGVETRALERFRNELVTRLRRMAFPTA